MENFFPITSCNQRSVSCATALMVDLPRRGPKNGAGIIVIIGVHMQISRILCSYMATVPTGAVLDAIV